MTASEHRLQLADLLEQVIEGKLQAFDALRQAEKWSDMPWEGNDVNAALNTLLHFHRATEIRAKKPEYDEDFRHCLRVHISQLRE